MAVFSSTQKTAACWGGSTSNKSRKNVPRTPSRIGIDREAGGERQRSLFEPFDAQELVTQRLFGWRRAAVPEPTIEALRHGRRSVYAITAAAATSPATPVTRMSFRRTARSCEMRRVRQAAQRASKSAPGAVATAECPPVLTGTAAVDSLGSVQPSKVCFGEG
jgi:hypothetical protein